MNKAKFNFIRQIPGWLSDDEGIFLYNSAKKTKKKKGVIVEVGSFKGKSTGFLASAEKRIYSVDPHKGNGRGFEVWRNF